MTDINDARTAALQFMEKNGGSVSIDITDGIEAVCALLLCIGLAKEGLCTHTRLTEHIGLFALTDNGYAALDPTP